jgi:hypothetical protein
VNWWIIVLVCSIVLSPLYAFIISKCVSAGWIAGARAYIKLYSKRRQ